MDPSALSSFDHATIINPIELNDQKWKEFEEKNPDLAKM